MKALILILAFCAFSSACSSTRQFQINLMPVPSLYRSGAIDPYSNGNPFSKTGYTGVLYATDRLPQQAAAASAADSVPGAILTDYENSSGFALRLGRAEVELEGLSADWDQVQKASLQSERSRDYPMQLGSIEEYGILQSSLAPLVSAMFPQSIDPNHTFQGQLEVNFQRSGHRVVHIYIPGARSPFDSAVLVGSEMWHYLGYHGAMVAYAWPAQPRGIGLSYFGDAESTVSSSRNFRLLLEYLANDVGVDRINIVTYSAGGRVALYALNQLALQGLNATSSKIGHVILTGSDVADTTFAGFAADGLLDTMERLTIFTSDKDRTLDVAEFVYGRGRLGRINDGDLSNPALIEYFDNPANPQFDVINVSNVSDDVPFGHSYFRTSPIVSSDIISTLLYNLTPEERGLERDSVNPIWNFPDDYITQLETSLLGVQSR